MKDKTDLPEQLPKGFFKQFKNKESFQDYFNKLFKQGIEEMLQSELDEHLGYLKHAKEGYNTGNSRNGTFQKTVTTENIGEMGIKEIYLLVIFETLEKIKLNIIRETAIKA